jgi:hypothetical protein
VITDAGMGFVWNSGTLSGVTYQGVLDLSSMSDEPIVTIVGGLTMTGAGGTGPGTIQDTGYASRLVFQNTQTIDNATINIGNANYTDYIFFYDSIGSGQTLTLGKNLTINQTGAFATLYGNGYSGDTVVNNGTINAIAAGGSLTISPLIFINNGAITVSNGDRLALQPTTFKNLANGVLTGGSYEADNNSIIELNQNAKIITDNATIILSGAGSTIEGYNTNTGKEVAIDSTLTGIGAAGVLKIFAGRNWTTTSAFTNAGVLYLGGGTFTAASLTDAAGATLKGNGVVATTVANGGTIEATGGTLTLQKAVTGTGGFQIDGGAALSLSAAIPTTAGILFNGAGAILNLSAAAGFTNTLSGLVAGDEIDLLKTAANAVVLNASNQLVVTNNGAAVATFNLSGSYADDDFSTQSDGNGGTFVVVGPDQAPATTTPATLFDNAGATVALTGIGVTDGDAVAYKETTTVVLSDTTGLLSAIASAGATVSGAGTTKLTLSGSLAAVNAELATLTYTGAFSNAPLTDIVTVATNDGRGGSNTHSIAVTVDQPPVATVPAAALIQTGVAAALSGFSVADPDAISLNQIITVTLTDSYGLLSAAAAAGATVGGAGTTSLTLSGGLAAVNAELASLTYTAATAGAPLTDTLTVAVNDGVGGSSGKTVAISLNQPPVTTAPASENIVDGVATAIAGISVADGDAVTAGETITVRLSDTAGLLSATAAAGATVTGAGTDSLTLSGGLAAVNAELATLTYDVAAAGAPAADTITVATSDGRGGSNSLTIGVSLDQPPVTIVPASELIQTGVVTKIAGISVADPDAVSRSQTITVTLTDSYGLLSATAASGATVAGAGTSALTLSGGLAAVNAELASLTYTAASAGAPLTDTLTVATSDGAGGSNSHTIGISLNQPPITTVPTGTLAVNSGAVTTIGGISVADADAAGAGETITVVITDTLGALSATAETGATVAGAGGKSLTLSGTLAGVNAELATLTYDGVLTGTASSGSDTINVATNDGRGGSNDHTIAVRVNHVLPVVTAPATLTELSGQTVTLTGFGVTDADPVSEAGKFTLTLTDKYGVLSATAETGATVAGAGTAKLTLAGTLAGVQAELATLIYTGGATGTKPTLADTLTFTATDSRGGSSSAKTAITIDHLPPVTTVPGAEKVASGVATPIAGISIADADPTAGTSVFTTTITDTSGLLSATAETGATVKGAGTKALTLSGTLAGVNAELATLTYEDTLAKGKTSATDTITITTADGHGDSDKHTIAVTITPTGSTSPGFANAALLSLFGQYMAAGFESDSRRPGLGDTTYVPPALHHLDLAASHR